MIAMATYTARPLMFVAAGFGLQPCLDPSPTVTRAAAVSRIDSLQIFGVGWVDKQLAHLLALPRDWDGYGADVVDPMRLNQIGALLAANLPAKAPPGSIVPAGDGSIQAEWHTVKSSFGLIVEEDGLVSTWMRRGDEEEIEASGIRACELLRFAMLDSML